MWLTVSENGTSYPITQLLTPQVTLNETAYAELGPPFVGTQVVSADQACGWQPHGLKLTLASALDNVLRLRRIHVWNRLDDLLRKEAGVR
jgi:hypothetical protein